MKHRKLGKTGLDVSILSFGASSLGSVFHDTNEAESIQAVHDGIRVLNHLIGNKITYSLALNEDSLIIRR